LKTSDEIPNVSGLSNVAVDTTTGMRTLVVGGSRAGHYVIIEPTTGIDSVEIQPGVGYTPTNFNFGYGCRRVYFDCRIDVSGSSAIWGCDAFTGADLTTITDYTLLDVNDLDGSPTEEKLVFSASGIGGGYTGNHIYSITEGGTGLTQLTFENTELQEPDGTNIRFSSGEHKPIWSPDGTKIAFYAAASNIDFGSPPHEVWITMNADGSSMQVVYVHITTAHYDQAGWSHDGEFLFINHANGLARKIVAVHLSSLTTTDITSGLGPSPYYPGSLTASPASMSIAFDRLYPGLSPLYVASLSAAGSSVSVLTSAQASQTGISHGYGNPDWAPFCPED